MLLSAAQPRENGACMEEGDEGLEAAGPLVRAGRA